MSICTTLRSAALASAFLFAAGLLLLLLAETTGILLPTAHAALLLVLGAVLTLAYAFVVALWPGSGSRLAECLH